MDDASNRLLPPRPPIGPWSALVQHLSVGVDHAKAFEGICDAGVTTGRYVVMSVLSAAIATLGLMLSSPAVVIGAMLLSPLMGPIILLGFSFWTVDWTATRRAGISLLVGFGVSLAVAVALTWLSPLKEPTSEILARTHPNLFDLLVAAFSGVAGGYAVIRQRGEAVIGVAIATALMPPIATIGFGLGTADWTVALGALLLFTTNLIAIALAAAGMAALYGFRQHYHLANRGWIGHLAVIAILAALCIPLTVSLNTIALESRATARVRAEVSDLFGPKARLTNLRVHSGEHGVEVDALVATPKYVAQASDRIARSLRAGMGVQAQVALDQVVLAEPSRFVQPAAAPAPPDPVTLAVQALRAAVPFPAASIGYDSAARRGLVLLGSSSGLDLRAAFSMEQGLRARPGLEGTEVLPPAQTLPAVPVALSAGAPPKFGPELALDLWALRRWRAARVDARLCGVSSRDRRRPQILAAAADALKPAGAEAAPGDARDCAGSGLGPRLVLRPG